MKRTPVRKRRRGGPRRGPSSVPPEQWRNRKYIDFLKTEGWCFPCSLAVLYSKPVPGGCDPAHGPINGLSSKGPDADAIPLCRTHHDEQHQIGWRGIEIKYGFRRKVIAAYWWNQFAPKEETCKS